MIYTIYGKPKTGKTTFSFSDADPKKTVVLNADKGLTGVDTTGFTIIDDVSSSNINKTLMNHSYIKRYERVIIDTATQLYEEMLTEISGGKTPTLHMRGMVNNAFSQLIRFLRQENKQIIILCQEKMVLPTEDWAPEDDDEQTTASVTVDLPQGAAKTLTTMSDVIGRLYVANTEHGRSRRLWLTPTPGIVAGARSMKFKNRPPYLVKPSMNRLNDLLGW